MTTPTLPPLPAPAHSPAGYITGLFTADQMHKYALAALAQPVPDAQDPMLACEIAPRPLDYPLTDYHYAGVAGTRLHYAWTDKPHRLLYDLIAAVRFYAAAHPQPVPLTEKQMRAAFAKLYPHDDAILHLAENNRGCYLEAIGAQHHWTAFKAGARAIEAAILRGIVPAAPTTGEGQ